jgi:hypothetical protein
MGKRYHVKSAKLTFGETAYEMASGPAAPGWTREAVDVTSLGDTHKQFIPGALIEDDEITVSIYDKGPNNRPKKTDAPAELAFEVKLSNGEDEDINADFTIPKAIITKVSPTSQDGSGDRKATVDVTFRPDGSVAAQSNG